MVVVPLFMGSLVYFACNLDMVALLLIPGINMKMFLLQLIVNMPMSSTEPLMVDQTLKK